MIASEKGVGGAALSPPLPGDRNAHVGPDDESVKSFEVDVPAEQTLGGIK